MLTPNLQKSALSVSAVAFFISNLLKNQLGPLVICGEISGLRRGGKASYLYFSLVDEKSKIDCLTHISSKGAKVLGTLQDGDQVMVFAQPSFYAAGGKLSFFTDDVLKLGAGLFASAAEKLKQKLYEEGLFREELKKPLPAYPLDVGVVTSAEGAVLQDIIRVAKDRWPLVRLRVFPALVQGEKAPESLRQALQEALSEPLDAVIIGRGGGSAEDLSAFNDEALVRLIHAAKTPIISAIGHEVDFSLCDYAADYSAPTPTGAAMKLFPDKNEVKKEIQSCLLNLRRSLQHRLREELYEVETLYEEIRLGWERRLRRLQDEVGRLTTLLENAHPERILARGYALILDSEGQRAEQFYPQQKINIVTAGHLVHSTVDEARKR